MAQNNREVDFAHAMENCAKEPIHIPGAVQSHGALLAFNATLDEVAACSDNIADFLAQTPEQLFTNTLQASFTHRFMSQLKQAVRRINSATAVTSFECSLTDNGKEVFCSVYKIRQSDYRQFVLVELEPRYVKLAGDFTSTVRQELERLTRTRTERQTLQQLVDSVAAISDYDRVLIYQFDSEWNGEVIAEHLRESDLDSYLGQHFPASDIPSQVRDMYQVNSLRKISSATSQPSQLLKSPQYDSLEPLDLSLGTLRAVSPIHAVYMQNMGVYRSLSVAIFDENTLWGILSCHGVRHARTNPYQRHAIHSLVITASQRLMLQRQYEAIAFFDKVEQSRKALLDPDKDIMAPQQLLTSQGKQWLQLFDVDVVVLVHGNEVCQVGTQIERQCLIDFAQWLRRHHWVSGLFSHRELGASDCPDGIKQSPYRGVLAVSMPYEKELNGWLLMFRREAIEIKSWAGAPRKTETQSFNGLEILSPRRSFASWEERLKGRSLQWTEAQKHAAKTLAEDLAIGASAYQIEQLNTQLQQANDRLEHLVHTDALTQLWNRYHMEQALDEELSRAQRHGHPLSVIIFDVDNFKGVNDQHGHEVGDTVLKGIASALKDMMRKSDALGRWGGEEFLVIAPETAVADAEDLAERLRMKLADIEFDKVGVVTASFGVTELEPKESRSDVVRRADHALYRAKEQGRNIVCVN